jgi:hypothetical protein
MAIKASFRHQKLVLMAMKNQGFSLFLFISFYLVLDCNKKGLNLSLASFVALVDNSQCFELFGNVGKIPNLQFSWPKQINS